MIVKKIGQPPKYDSEDKLIEQIEEYFAEAGSKTNITGLCLYLGFESRQSFYDYEKRGNFSYIIKRARLMIENGYEVQAQDSKTPTYQIFALKNMGWSDRMEVDQKTEMSGSLENKTTISFTKGNK